MAKYLFYCVNGTGLGHITRCLAVARQMRALDPNNSFLFLTSSEHSGILWAEGFTCVKIPSYEIGKADRNLSVASLTTAITAQVFATFRPDVFVVDSLAGGMYGEMMTPLLSYNRKVFIYGNFPNYFSKPSYKYGFTLYDMFIVPFKPEERERIGIEFTSAQTFWVGDILVRSRKELWPREAVRARLGISPEATVLYVALGGGGNPANDTVYDWLLTELAAWPEFTVVVPEQPLGGARDWHGRFPTVRTVRHFPAVELSLGFDAVISAAGFNCGEFVHAGLPVLWVPLGFPSTDQDFNAQRFVDNGIGQRVAPMDTEALRGGLHALRDSGYRRQQSGLGTAFLAENGAEGAARMIFKLSRVSC